MRIVLVGECMVELAPATVDGQFQLSFAGDTFNTAWYLRKLRPDWSVDYVTEIGKDAISDQMLNFIDGHGVGTTHIARHPTRTVGLYMISLQDGERSFSYWRGQSAAKELARDAARLDAAFAGADLIYVSGITLAILDEAGRALLLDRLQAAKGFVAFDTNLRPKLWPDAPTMCAAMMQAAAVSDVVLPSHDDEAAHFGDATPEATLERYVAAGAGTVVVKNGPGAIHFIQDGTRGVITPTKVSDVIDTTAAGDSFNAAILVAAAERSPMQAAARTASRLAARVICGRGALVEIDDFVQEVSR